MEKRKMGNEVATEKLRVLIITQSLDRIAAPLVNSDVNVVGIVESATRNYNKNRKVRDLFYTMRSSRLNPKRSKSIRYFCRTKNIKYFFMSDGGDQRIASWIKDSNVDLICVFGMSQLLKANVFDAARLGTINIHPSLLPHYRGPNPDFWQYLNMEKKQGVTIHYIDEAEDTGDIIKQEEVSIPLGMRSKKRLDKIVGKVGYKLLLETINDLSQGIVVRNQQVKSNADLLRARNIKECEHRDIIKWEHWSGLRVWNVLRGTESWLCAFEKPWPLLPGQRWTIGEFELVENQREKAGMIYQEDGNHYIATSDGRIYISRKLNFKNMLLSLIR